MKLQELSLKSKNYVKWVGVNENTNKKTGMKFKKPTALVGETFIDLPAFTEDLINAVKSVAMDDIKSGEVYFKVYEKESAKGMKYRYITFYKEHKPVDTNDEYLLYWFELKTKSWKMVKVV